MPEKDWGTKQSYAIAYDARGRGAYLSFAGQHPMLCAEPPPDTSANFADTTSSSGSGNANVGYKALSVAAGVQGQNTETVTSTVADVVKRSELNLLVRDIFYRLCEMQFNGNFIDPKTHEENVGQIQEMFNKALDATLKLGERDNVAQLIALAGSKDIDPDTRKKLVDAASQAIIGQLIAQAPNENVARNLQTLVAPSAHGTGK